MSLLVSLIIPVYNRPDQIRELLISLVGQSRDDFEVVIVDDGSDNSAEKVVAEFYSKLNLVYCYNTRMGPGRTRNKGCSLAKGDYFVFIDSDCLLPANYIAILYEMLRKYPCDAFGGVDTDHPSFSNFQKAVNHSMTSFLTTGGIRGRSEALGKFQPRSFNMGISRKVWETTGGFSGLQYGEDIDLSLRILANGFSIKRFAKLCVYHKRRTNFRLFAKQIFNFARGRVRINRQYPQYNKLIYSLPAIFFLGHIGLVISSFWFGFYSLLPPLLFMAALIIEALFRGIDIALLVVPVAYTQLFSYGIGFLYENSSPPPPPKSLFPENTDK